MMVFLSICFRKFSGKVRQYLENSLICILYIEPTPVMDGIMHNLACAWISVKIMSIDQNEFFDAP